MPTSARKSSVGTSRRGPVKGHIPYRGDNPEVGKRTGIAVQHVDRKSDGFEPFEEVIQQADKCTPPNERGRKRRKPIVVLDDDDEDGEMSMELDDSNPQSPLQYFTNYRQPTTPSNLNRVGASTRPVIRSSDVDFDELPSPRPRAAARTSQESTFGPGPSNLSKSTVPQDPDPDPDLQDDHFDEGGMEGGFDDYGPQDDDSPDEASPRRASFSEMDQDNDKDEDEDEEGAEEELPEVETPTKSRNKGKGREDLHRVTRENDEQYPGSEEARSMEDEIAQGLEDVAFGQHTDEEEPQRKKSRVESERSKGARAKPRGKPKKEWGAEAPQGVRRSKRTPYAPLEWWRLEKVVYGRRESGVTLVPHIKEIIRIPKEPSEPLGKAKRKRGTTRPRSRSQVKEDPDDKRLVETVNPEEGWDDDTEPQAVVLDFPSMREVTRRVAYTEKMLEPKPAANNDWFFQKVFGDGDFIAAGVLIIPPRGRKPSKGTKDNTYIFYVIEGAVNLKVHETSVVLTTGGMFMVPRGNTYFIENIADRDAKLFFTQARKIIMGEDEHAAQESGSALHRSSDSQLRKTARSSSAVPSGLVNGRALSTVPGKRAVSTKI